MIPDHEVLRIIGGGAYGEVWLARAVTGALRGVKVVWRRDFEDERGFEREFEGILKFEPISRDHPGFVNILHVGRSSAGEDFYYYVMELADDVRTGRDINPIEYEPRTLRADNKAGEQWDVNQCVAVGLRLAEALGRLHEEDLAHRDVKPANVIFVNGKAKLADIGLVAARGQRTFVGTEGFVPPEGPGTRRADVYSLGKVLYEIATGKDRLCFPDLPETIPDGEDGKRWRDLNQIICDTCDPRQAKRKISTAQQLIEALTRIQRGKRRRRRALSLWATSSVLLGFAGVVGWQAARQAGWSFDFSSGSGGEEAAKIGWVRIFSTPQGADIYDPAGVIVDCTPSKNLTARIGEDILFILKKDGFRDQEVRAKVPRSAVDEPLALSVRMMVFRPPVVGQTWVDSYGNSYNPQGSSHVGRRLITTTEWNDFRKSAPNSGGAEFVKTTQDSKESEVVLCQPALARRFCAWMAATQTKEGHLTDDEEMLPVFAADFAEAGMSARAVREKLAPFRIMVRGVPYGRLDLASTPEDAEVYVNGVPAGKTGHGGLIVPKVRPGIVEILFIREGYKPYAEKISVGEREVLVKSVTLAKNQGVVFGKPWENGLGMRFVPLGEDLMVSAWEIRLRDFRQFVRESGHPSPVPPDFDQDEEHPVVNVSRTNAEAFCAWLTKREREKERIGQNSVYRLPTDAEWSLMAGIREEETASPASRDMVKEPVFPWDGPWSNDAKHGNYADLSLAESESTTGGRVIPGYNDGYPHTAPVGSFPPNRLGIHDLGGNVQEWVSDPLTRGDVTNLGVLRGGGWTDWEMEKMFAGSRNAAPPEYADRMYGFRVVLAKEPPATETPANP